MPVTPSGNWCKCGHHEDDHGPFDETDWEGAETPKCQAVVGDGICQCKAFEL